jgi:hypothetical protein
MAPEPKGLQPCQDHVPSPERGRGQGWDALIGWCGSRDPGAGGRGRPPWTAGAEKQGLCWGSKHPVLTAWLTPQKRLIRLRPLLHLTEACFTAE